MRLNINRPALRQAQTVDYVDYSADYSAGRQVLRNTYMLLSMTLLFSAVTAAASIAFALPAPGPLLTLIGYFGLLMLTTRLRNSGWGLVSVFALTGFMGYSLGPILSFYLRMPGGSAIVMTAMAMTGAIFLGLSAYARVSKRDFSFLGGMLFAGMIVAVLAGLAAMFFHIPALSLAISAIVVLLMAGMILFETQNIVRGGETNYIMATVSLYVTIFNLFINLLQLLGFAGRDD
jgi:modulator of FtsH protease